MNEFDIISIDSVLEDTEYAIDATLDYVQEADADVEASVSTDVDVSVIDSIIGEDGKGSVALISDEDIEKIDKGEDPDFDGIDKDALKGEKDKEIKQLADDIKDNSIITKNEIKELKEGQDLLDFVGSIITEDSEDELIKDDNSDNEEEVVFKFKNDKKINDDEYDNEPAGPVQPLNDCKEQNQYGFNFDNEEGEFDMANAEDLFEESVEDLGKEYGIDEDAEIDAEDLTDEMNDLDNIDLFNEFEGTDINAKQFGENDFLTGMKKNDDEPSGNYKSFDSLKFESVDKSPFSKACDDSKCHMIL